jgi:curli biogenesis system outer membrane secretion channel CsgG
MDFKRNFCSALALAISGSVFAQGFFDNKLGGANSPVSGSASADGAKNAALALEKCEKPFGTIAVVQPQDQFAVALQRFSLPPPTNLLRLMIQQSNCFQVVERGLGMQNLMQERALAQGGQLQSGSNVGKGQMVTADFLLTPEVNFSEKNAGGAGIGAIGGMFGVFGAVAGAIASGIKFKQASTTLILADARSGLQVAAAEGSNEKADWAVGGFLGGVGAGAYTNTAEGKIVAAALLDNYNNIVRAVRNQPTLVQPTADSSASKNAATSKQANAFNEGDVLRGKIGGIKVLEQSLANSKTLYTLKKEDEVVFLGEETNGFLKVQGSDGDGWVDKKLVMRP